MTAASILTECLARQIRLVIKSDALTFEGPPGAMDAALLGLIRQHKAELLEQLKAANDPGPVAHRWRISHPDGCAFEVSCYPPCTLAEVQADNPGAQVEAVSMPMGGHLPHEDVEIIEAVCRNWNASVDEIQDALHEAAATPALMANWRREAEKLGLDIHTHPETQLHLVAQGFEADIGADMDDRIYCQQCRLLRPSGLCGSPAWGSRYHPPSLPHRCGEFLPRAGDPDQRTGRERWPGLMEERP